MAECQRQAAVHTDALLQRASSHFGAIIPPVDIRFDLTGKAAGVVRYSRDGAAEIRYNGVLLRENCRDFILRTVPHEVAHVVARAIFGSCRPHGEEWHRIMAFFGAESSRCHTYDTSRSSSRRMRRYDYLCGCSRHRLSAVRHNRSSRGQSYICRRCGERLQLVENIKPGTDI